ncbi:hypothetical protein KO505_12745 [Psychrosphaera sp. F3M07]|nr:hypothetical protein [Psychrosphaera sp. F3M07]
MTAVDCVTCHQSAVNDWQQSDHAKAMDLANEKTILGNFNNVTTKHFSQQARFYIQDELFKIDLTEGDKLTTYTVNYTFGHYPLQQYLVPAQGGRFQVFPFAWDSRQESQGGQRWYPNYANEDIKSNDRLHWQQPLQNWNGMCADCHSDGLKRNYSIAENSFETKWDNINVGCQSCHGKMDDHTQVNVQTSSSLIDSPQQHQQVLNWLIKPGEKVAKLRDQQGKLATKQEKRDKGKFMDTCFSCHSLRSPLTDGIQPEQEFLNQFSPSLLSQPFYHSDGQIKEEVYVYGSFLQSKMFAEGVTCLNCHNKHTMKVKTQSNGLCLQCHSSEVYQQEKHTQHPLTSSGGQCVNCHMPETTYMSVDARRDHSFRIPRPDLSAIYNTPNACINCHQDQDNLWAVSHLEKWHGKSKILSDGEQLFIELQHQGGLPLDLHFKLINDLSLNEIKRASAIMLLPNSTAKLSDSQVQSWIASDEPLIRLAMAKVGHLLPLNERIKHYKSLLNDQYKAIRIASATHLVNLGLEQSVIFKNAFDELVFANEVSSWRGEGNLNQSLIHLNKGQTTQTISALNKSISVDPYFDVPYVNLADVYKNLNDNKNEKSTLDKGLTFNPKSANLHYSYGMYLIRLGDKKSSINSFASAIRYDNTNPQFAYLYILALDSVGNTQKAIRELKLIIKRYNYNRQLLQLGLGFAQKQQDRSSYQYFAQYMKP